MSTRTATYAHTRVETATYLADVVLGAIGDILGALGIDPARLWEDWERDEAAISAWIQEGSLKEVVLECHPPSGVVKPVFEFAVTNDAGGHGDTAFVASRARLARYMAKLKSVPAGTTFRLFCTFSGPRSPQPGWGPGTRASTEGLRSTSFGSLAEGPHARVGLRYLSGD